MEGWGGQKQEVSLSRSVFPACANEPLDVLVLDVKVHAKSCSGAGSPASSEDRHVLQPGDEEPAERFIIPE